MKVLTAYQLSILKEAGVRGVTSRFFRLQSLNMLAGKGLLEPFYCEPEHYYSGRMIISFHITDNGQSVLRQNEGPCREVLTS